MNSSILFIAAWILLCISFILVLLGAYVIRKMQMEDNETNYERHPIQIWLNVLPKISFMFATLILIVMYSVEIFR